MHYKNGQSAHYLYGVWQDMKRRCFDPKRVEYQNYGGRGITVCQYWLDDFWNFVEDVGARPKGCSLDRINNDKGYSKENCKWSTRKEQNQNKRSTYVNTKHKNIYVRRGKYQVILTKPKRKYIGVYKTLEEAKTKLQAVGYQLCP